MGLPEKFNFIRFNIDEWLLGRENAANNSPDAGKQVLLTLTIDGKTYRAVDRRLASAHRARTDATSASSLAATYSNST